MTKDKKNSIDDIEQNELSNKDASILKKEHVSPAKKEYSRPKLTKKPIKAYSYPIS